MFGDLVLGAWRHPSVAAAGLNNEAYHRARLAGFRAMSHVVEMASGRAAGVA